MIGVKIPAHKDTDYSFISKKRVEAEIHKDETHHPSNTYAKVRLVKETYKHAPGTRVSLEEVTTRDLGEVVLNGIGTLKAIKRVESFLRHNRAYDKEVPIVAYHAEPISQPKHSPLYL